MAPPTWLHQKTPLSESIVQLRLGRRKVNGAAILGLSILPALLVADGCQQRKGPPRAAVSGRVTLDGKEIEQGSIAFKAVGPNAGMAAGGPIKNGRYSVDKDRGPVIGQNRIEIKSTRTSGKQVQAPLRDPGQMTDEIVEAIPAMYNSQSTLEREVKAVDNQFDFDLQSQ